MSTTGERVVWRVRAEAHVDEKATFDGVLIFHKLDQRELSTGGALRVPVRQYFNRPVPFEETLTDAPFTLVLRSHTGNAALVVEFESSACRGRASASADSPAVIVHTASGAAFSGLPNSPQADHEFDWHSFVDKN